MTFLNCPALETPEDLKDNAKGIAQGISDSLTDLIQRNAREDGMKAWLSFLLKNEKTATQKTLFISLVAAGLAPIFLPAIGIDAPPGFLSGALFNWTTGIGTRALGGWFANFAASHKQNGIHGDSKDLAIVEAAQELVQSVAEGDIKLLIGICKIVKEKNLLPEFENAYRSEFGKDLIPDIHMLIFNASKQLTETLETVTRVEEGVQSIQAVENRIASLENENYALRELNKLLIDKHINESSEKTKPLQYKDSHKLDQSDHIDANSGEKDELQAGPNNTERNLSNISDHRYRLGLDR